MASLDFGDGDKKSRDVLDLSAVIIRSDSELKKWLEKVPDFKIRPEKVRSEDVIPGGEDGTISAGSSPVRHEASRATASATTYPFCDPIPTSMKDVCIRELGRVNISWRMLTVSRPKTKLEEDIFSRLVQLEKLQYKTIMWENEQEAMKESKGSSGAFSFRIANSRGRARAPYGRGASTKAAVTERRVQTCKECGEEFCLGTCKKYMYDDHARTLNPVSDDIFKTTQKKKAKKTSGGKKASGANAEANHCGEDAGLAAADQHEEVGVNGAAVTVVRPLTTKTVADSAAEENGTKENQNTVSPKAKEKGAKPKLHRVGKKPNKSKKR